MSVQWVLLHLLCSSIVETRVQSPSLGKSACPFFRFYFSAFSSFRNDDVFSGWSVVILDFTIFTWVGIGMLLYTGPHLPALASVFFGIPTEFRLTWPTPTTRRSSRRNWWSKCGAKTRYFVRKFKNFGV